jgi:hypothetical protein
MTIWDSPTITLYSGSSASTYDIGTGSVQWSVTLQDPACGYDLSGWCAVLDQNSVSVYFLLSPQVLGTPTTPYVTSLNWKSGNVQWTQPTSTGVTPHSATEPIAMSYSYYASGRPVIIFSGYINSDIYWFAVDSSSGNVLSKAGKLPLRLR